MRSTLTTVVLAVGIAACGPKAKRRATPVVRAEALTHDAYAHYLRGQLAAFEGKLDTAIEELRKATVAAPDESSPVLALADALYRDGQRQDAVELLGRAEKRWPKDMRIWRLSGHLHRSYRRHDDAIRRYAKALKLEAGDPEAAVALGEEYLWLSEPKKALRVFHQLSARKGEMPDGFFGEARALMRLGRWKDALAKLDQVIELAPWVNHAWAFRAHCLRQLGRTDEAAEALRLPFDRSRGDIDVANELVDGLLMFDGIELATASVLHLDRDDLASDARISLGGLYLRLGRFDLALAFADALESKLGQPPALSEYRAQALVGANRIDEAVALLAAIPSEDPAFAPLRALAVEILVDAGKLDEAAALLVGTEERLASQPDLLLATVALEFSQGKRDAAWKRLDEALREHPRSSRLFFARAELAKRAGKMDDATATIQALLDLSPNDPTVLNYLGFLLLESGRSLDRARDLLERALDARPESPFIRDSLGWLYFKNGRVEEAAPYLERAARMTPAEPELLWHMAELRRAQGRSAQAKALFDRALQLVRDPSLRAQIEVAAKRPAKGS